MRIEYDSETDALLIEFNKETQYREAMLAIIRIMKSFIKTNMVQFRTESTVQTASLALIDGIQDALGGKNGDPSAYNIFVQNKLEKQLDYETLDCDFTKNTKNNNNHFIKRAEEIQRRIRDDLKGRVEGNSTSQPGGGIRLVAEKSDNLAQDLPHIVPVDC